MSSIPTSFHRHSMFPVYWSCDHVLKTTGFPGRLWYNLRRPSLGPRDHTAKATPKSGGVSWSCNSVELCENSWLVSFKHRKITTCWLKNPKAYTDFGRSIEWDCEDRVSLCELKSMMMIMMMMGSWAILLLVLYIYRIEAQWLTFSPLSLNH